MKTAEDRLAEFFAACAACPQADGASASSGSSSGSDGVDVGLAAAAGGRSGGSGSVVGRHALSDWQRWQNACLRGGWQGGGIVGAQDGGKGGQHGNDVLSIPSAAAGNVVPASSGVSGNFTDWQRWQQACLRPATLHVRMFPERNAAKGDGGKRGGKGGKGGKRHKWTPSVEAIVEASDTIGGGK